MIKGLLNIDLPTKLHDKIEKKYLKGVKMKVYPVMSIIDGIVNVDAVFTTKADALRYVDDFIEDSGFTQHKDHLDIRISGNNEVRIYAVDLSENYKDE